MKLKHFTAPYRDSNDVDKQFNNWIDGKSSLLVILNVEYKITPYRDTMVTSILVQYQD